MSTSANNILKAAATEHCDTPAMSRSTDRTAYTRCYDKELRRLRTQANPTVTAAPSTSKKIGTGMFVVGGIVLVAFLAFTSNSKSSSKSSNGRNLRTNGKLNLKK